MVYPSLSLVPKPKEESYGAAPFLFRALAFMLDCFLVAFFAKATMQVFLFSFARFYFEQDIQTLLSGNAVKVQVLQDFAMLYSYMFYTAIFHWHSGSTVGKKIFGLKVCDERGHPLSLKQSIVRSLSYLVSYFPMGLGFAIALVRKDANALHDLLSRSKVVLAKQTENSEENSEAKAA